MPGFSALLLSCLLPLAEPIQLTPGLQLSYQGTVAPLDESRSAGNPEKQFDLMLLVAEHSAEVTQLYWAVDERGRGAWPWIERVGRLEWQPDGNTTGLGPALLYNRDDGTSTISLVLPLLESSVPWAAGATWERRPWTYQVQRANRVDDRDVWQVSVSNSYGLRRTESVAQGSQVVVSRQERVFMGMGQEYQLKLRLVGTETLSAADLSKLQPSLNSLVALREKLGRPDRHEEANWNAAQLVVLKEQVPLLTAGAKWSATERIVQAAARDLGLQDDRQQAIIRRVAEFEGQAVGEFKIGGVNQETVTQADLPQNVTVLHFWDYRDEPLKEPYGQVGYLDFLAQRRKAEGVQVYGVAVDGRLNSDAERGQAIRGVRKLQAFMNLSYPILLDGGALIKQFGDPRLLGAELPLYVVIGPNGKIFHYHVGYYEVDRNDGLKQLNAIVGQALSLKTAPK